MMALRCLVLGMLVFASAAYAAGPFRSNSNHPLRVGGLDPTPAAPDKPFARDFLVESDIEFASVYLAGNSDDGTQIAIFDYEMTKLNLGLSARIGDSDWAFFGSLGIYHFANGFLDDFLDGYHDALGLPNSGRSERPDDAFSNQITDNAFNTIIGGESGGLKLGALNLGVQWWLGRGNEIDYAFRASVALPTGDEDAFLDAGFEASIGVLADYYVGDFSFVGNLDIVMPFEDQPFGDPSIESMPWVKAMISTGYYFAEDWTARAQLALSTPSRDSSAGFFHLDEMNLLGTFGVDWSVSDHCDLQLAIGEDLNPGVDADFSLLLSMEWNFGE